MVCIRSTLRSSEGGLSAWLPPQRILHRRMFHLRQGEPPLPGMDSGLGGRNDGGRRGGGVWQFRFRHDLVG